jgi:four helix bundle protein
MERRLLAERVLSFAECARKVCRSLEYIKENDTAKQLKRASTAIGASVYEAQYAESVDDFIHKMKIACKEANEANFWIKYADGIITIDRETKVELEIIQKILNKSIATAIKRRKTLGRRSSGL